MMMSDLSRHRATASLAFDASMGSSFDVLKVGRSINIEGTEIKWAAGRCDVW
jgi:hypothetical protein